MASRSSDPEAPVSPTVPTYRRNLVDLRLRASRARHFRARSRRRSQHTPVLEFPRFFGHLTTCAVQARKDGVFTVPAARPAYPEEFRREAVQMLRAARTPRELAESLGVSQRRAGLAASPLASTQIQIINT